MNANQYAVSSKAHVIGAAALANLETQVRNGVKEPSQHDITRPVWNALDELVDFGLQPNVWTARKLATKNGWDINSTVVVFHCWNKFHKEQ